MIQALHGLPEDPKPISTASVGTTDDCKDVVMVSSLPGPSPLASPASHFHEAAAAAAALCRLPFPRRPAPSKWDDAHKWIAGRKRAEALLGCGIESGQQPRTKVVMEVVKESIERSAVNLSQYESSVSLQSATTIITPPSTVRSVSMRDMGTEMTPTASQEPSRTGTPTRLTTLLCSATSSQPSTPQRTAPTSNHVLSADCQRDHNTKELSERELQMQTRREILFLGRQLGKTSITAWASKEEDGMDSSISLKTMPVNEAATSAIDTHAAAWEEAEKAKYLARFKQEEIKIQAWENHEKAKTEAEMRKIEVEVEKMRARAHDRLVDKLATARHKAEEKRATAEARRNQEAAQTAEQVEYIRKTGHVPSSCCCWSWCS